MVVWIGALRGDFCSFAAQKLCDFDRAGLSGRTVDLVHKGNLRMLASPTFARYPVGVGTGRAMTSARKFAQT